MSKNLFQGKRESSLTINTETLDGRPELIVTQVYDEEGTKVEPFSTTIALDNSTMMFLAIRLLELTEVTTK